MCQKRPLILDCTYKLTPELFRKPYHSAEDDMTEKQMLIKKQSAETFNLKLQLETITERGVEKAIYEKICSMYHHQQFHLIQEIVFIVRSTL